MKRHWILILVVAALITIATPQSSAAPPVAPSAAASCTTWSDDFWDRTKVDTSHNAAFIDSYYSVAYLRDSVMLANLYDMLDPPRTTGTNYAIPWGITLQDTSSYNQVANGVFMDNWHNGPNGPDSGVSFNYPAPGGTTDSFRWQVRENGVGCGGPMNGTRLAKLMIQFRAANGNDYVFELSRNCASPSVADGSINWALLLASPLTGITGGHLANYNRNNPHIMTLYYDAGTFTACTSYASICQTYTPGGGLAPTSVNFVELGIASWTTGQRVYTTFQNADLRWAKMGWVRSVAIPRPSPGKWGIFNASHINNDGAITYDILDGTTNAVLASNVAPGTDLDSIGITAASIKLRGNLSRPTYNDLTPELEWWSVDVCAAPTPPPLNVGPVCDGGTSRTVTWTTAAGEEYNVQAATDAGFTTNLQDSGWLAVGTSSHTFTGLTETLWYYRIRARDGTLVGNWSATSTASQDLTAPTTTAIPAGTAGNSPWYLSNVNVSLTTVDPGCGTPTINYQIDGGGFGAYGGPFAVTGEGSHTVDYYATDGWNTEFSKTLALWIDTVDPATSSIVTGTAGNAGWYTSSSVQVGLAGIDATSGISATNYQIDGGGFTAYGSPFTVSGEGSHVLQFNSDDVAGNGESVQNLNLKIDSVRPTSAITSLSDNDWVSGTVSVAGTASDATSGVSVVDLSTNGGSSWTGATGTLAWSGSWDTTTGPDGDYNVGSRAEDAAGNVQVPNTILIHVDNTAPGTMPTFEGTVGLAGWWRSAVSVTLSPSDGAGIGIEITQYQVDGGGMLPYTVPFSITGEGSHTLDYRSRDLLGNTEGWQLATLRIDTVPPLTSATISGTLGLNGWITDSVTVTLTALDATSGVDTTFLDGVAVGGPVAYTTDGHYSLRYYATDVAGNQEAARTTAFKLDTAPPVGSAQGGSFCPACGQQISLNLSGSDATSGVCSWRAQVQGGVGKTWSGSGFPPSTVIWNGRLAGGQIAGVGSYPVELWLQDCAGWTTTARSRVIVSPAPPPPPAPPETATPTATATPTRTPSPTSTPALTGIPFTPRPTVTPTPQKIMLIPPPEKNPAISLRVQIFNDENSDAHRIDPEPGLGGLWLHVQGEGWSHNCQTNANGVVTITLPGPGAYTATLVDRPGPNWNATTQTQVTFRAWENGGVDISSNEDSVLPIGSAEGMKFAIGLLLQRIALWLPLAAIALLFPAPIIAVLDKRAKALQQLEETLSL